MTAVCRQFCQTAKCPILPVPAARTPRTAKPRRAIMSNEQKVAIITGASQGIGAGLVKAYRDRGYRVVATSRSIKPTNDKDVVAVAGDIADPKTAEAVVD